MLSKGGGLLCKILQKTIAKSIIWLQPLEHPCTTALCMTNAFVAFYFLGSTPTKNHPGMEVPQVCFDFSLLFYSVLDLIPSQGLRSLFGLDSVAPNSKIY